MTNEILAIIGTIASMILGINAYFIKQLVDRINDTKVSIAVLIEQNKFKDSEISRMNADIAELKVFSSAISHKVSAIEIHFQIKQFKNEGN